MSNQNDRKKWQLQQAKARFSELVKRSQAEGPQEITVHDEPAAYLVSKADFERLTQRGENLADWLLSSPLAGSNIKLKRDRSGLRDVSLG